jgi:hypothetical protein
VGRSLRLVKRWTIDAEIMDVLLFGLGGGGSRTRKSWPDGGFKDRCVCRFATPPIRASRNPAGLYSGRSYHNFVMQACR